MAGWENELDELMRARGSALVRYAYMLSGDRALAEDLVQDALVKVYSRLRGTPASPGRWACPRAARRTTSTPRSRTPRATCDGRCSPSTWTATASGSAGPGIKHLLAEDLSTRGADQAASARIDVMAALARLGARERACVVLRYFEDMTVPQIAEVLGTAQGTVKRYLSDATKNMQEFLRPDDFRPAEGRAAR